MQTPPKGLQNVELTLGKSIVVPFSTTLTPGTNFKLKLNNFLKCDVQEMRSSRCDIPIWIWRILSLNEHISLIEVDEKFFIHPEEIVFYETIFLKSLKRPGIILI